MPDEMNVTTIDLGCVPTACSGCRFTLEQSEFFTRVVFDAVALRGDGFYHDVGIGQLEFLGTWVTQFEFTDGIKREGEVDLGPGFYEIPSSRWKERRVEAEKCHVGRIAQMTHSTASPVSDVRHFLVVGSGAQIHCLANEFSFRHFQDE